MTEIGEVVAVSLADKDNYDDKCPFCYEAPHDFQTKKAKPNPVVESIPEQLGCADLPVTGTWIHTTAKHHLISAKQCYAKLRRLVRMASMVEYDINHKNNGIALPTIAKNIKFTVGGVGPKNYGSFGDAGKQEIAFGVMSQAKAQWHVGHHAVSVDIPADDDGGEDDDSTMGHSVSYDESVVKELLKLMDAWVEAGWCAEDEDKSNSLIKDMDNISANIKAKLNMFAVDQPKESYPYFVSRMAHAYAYAQEQDDEPPHKNTKLI